MTKFSPSIPLSILSVAWVAAASTSAFANSNAPPSVVVFDQPIAGKSVDVAYVMLPTNGYVAVYSTDATGKPIREAIGTAQLKVGDHRNVKITLNDQPKSGQKLWISLYSDTDGKAGFDPKADLAIWQASLPSENAFLVR